VNLSARQRSMLAEMGIRVFIPDAPEATDDQPPVAATAAALAAATPAAVQRAFVAAPAASSPVIAADAPVIVQAPSADGIACLDWNALEQSVAGWAAARRRKPVFGQGDRQPDWLCVGDPPVEEEAHQGAPFVGDEGQLLDNMLAAVGASRRRGAFLTNAFKCRLPDAREEEAGEAAHWALVLQRQVELLQPRVILAMGRFAVQMLLQTNEPPGKLRGRVHRYREVPVVVTYHPKYLLHNLPDKARAWADLCLAQAVLRDGA
jgi:uracil-DNA glycosylase